MMVKTAPPERADTLCLKRWIHRCPCARAPARSASARCWSTRSPPAARSAPARWTKIGCVRSRSRSRIRRPTSSPRARHVRQPRTELNTARSSAARASSMEIARSSSVPSASSAARSVPGSSPASSGGVHQRPSSFAAMFATDVSVTCPRVLTRTTSSASGWRARASSYGRRDGRLVEQEDVGRIHRRRRRVPGGRVRAPRSSAAHDTVDRTDPRVRRSRILTGRSEPAPASSIAVRTAASSNANPKYAAELRRRSTCCSSAADRLAGIAPHRLEQLERRTAGGQDPRLRHRLVVLARRRASPT